MNAAASSIHAEQQAVRAVLRELEPFYRVNRFRVYADITLTAFLAWGSLFVLASERVPWFGKIGLWVLAYVAFYRGILFLHDVSHLGHKIKGLALLYNIYFGYPCHAPAYVYDQHFLHHLPTTFGTGNDPEYVYLKNRVQRPVSYLLLLLQAGILVPIAMTFRFGVFPLIALFMKPEKYLSIMNRTSAIAMKPYVRNITWENFRRYRREDLISAAYFLASLILICLHLIPLIGILAFCFLEGAVAAVNILRARIAHRYENPYEQLSPFSQFTDAVTVERSALGFLWGPLGLQYHAVHHLAPQIPYYNLKAAHRQLRTSLAWFEPYQTTVVPGVYEAIKRHLKTVSGREFPDL